MSSRFIMPFADVGSGIKPSSGAKLFFFELDGVTPKNTFSDQLSTPTANTNPVISDSNGVFGDIYITGSYKVDLQNKNGSQIFGGAIVEELGTGALIDDLSQAYEFPTVASYKGFAGAPSRWYLWTRVAANLADHAVSPPRDSCDMAMEGMPRYWPSKAAPTVPEW